MRTVDRAVMAVATSDPVAPAVLVAATPAAVAPVAATVPTGVAMTAGTAPPVGAVTIAGTIDGMPDAPPVVASSETVNSVVVRVLHPSRPVGPNPGFPMA